MVSRMKTGNGLSIQLAKRMAKSGEQSSHSVQQSSDSPRSLGSARPGIRSERGRKSDRNREGLLTPVGRVPNSRPSRSVVQVQRGGVVGPTCASVNAANGDRARSNRHIEKNHQHPEDEAETRLGIDGNGTRHDRANRDGRPKPVRHHTAILHPVRERRLDVG